MRSIMVMNAKGGCGKTTLATNIAAYYADKGKDVVLVDFDPQGCSMDWLARRPKDRAPIRGVTATKPDKQLPENCDVLVIDAPARVHGGELTQLMRQAETIVMPVLPSTIDMDAADRFLKEMQSSPPYRNRKVKVGLVANRARDVTNISYELDQFLDKKRQNYVAYLRDAMNYVRAYTRGLGIHELPSYISRDDRAQLKLLFDWLDSERSRP